MPETYYKYKVTFTSGRELEFTTSKTYQALTNIECLNENGTICGHLAINESLVESVFVKKFEPSITKEQQEILDWVDKANQSPEQSDEPYVGVPMIDTDGTEFTMYIEK